MATRRRRSPARRQPVGVERAAYDSIAALAADFRDAYGTPHGERGVNPRPEWVPDWHGVGSYAELRYLAEHGYQDAEADALAITDSVIDSIERDHDVDLFTPTYGVAGSAVDVGRFLSGEPECMVDYQPVPTPSVGRVITLCASVCYSATVSTRTIERRGHIIAALAFALCRVGLAVELWADMSTQQGSGETRVRVMVKGANDELDAAKIMFAYSHTAMFRGLGCGAPVFEHGIPVDAEQDLPDGTLYLPAVCSDRDLPDAHREVERLLRELGVITGDAAA